jgi:hypothetical protein
MLASTASQDDDPLSCLRIGLPMPGVYDWGFGDQNFNMLEPFHTTGGRNGNGDWGNSLLADFAVGFGWYGVDTSVPGGLGVRGGVGEQKGLLEPRTGG